MSPTLRSIIFSALLVGATGCATSSAPHPKFTTDPNAPKYFQGLESEYVVRLTSLPDEKSLPEDSVMREALLSGDGDLYVSAALFRSGDKLCMDLIVLNHADEPIEIGRGNLRLVDGEGRFFELVEDFEGADQYGLRSRRKRSEKNLPAVAPPEWSSESLASDPSDLSGTSGKAVRTPTPRPMPSSARLTDWGQLSNRPEAGAPNVPERIRVDAEQGRAYWAYWRGGGSLHFPLTAFVTLGERHLMFQFEGR